MPQISRSALVAYSAEQMYQLVNDVLSYPKFLPGCVGSRLISSTDVDLVASIDVSKIGIRKTFTTKNQMVPGRSIDLQLVDGPFRKLDGKWRFTPLGDDACKIEFYLDFEFSSGLIDLAFRKIFGDLMGSMVGAFQKRAKEVYGG